MITTSPTATYTVDTDGSLRITHAPCGRVQVVAPIAVDDDGYAYFGSSADFCLACEAEGRDAGIILG